MNISKENILEFYYRRVINSEIKKGQQERIIELKNILDSLKNIELDKNKGRIK